MVSLPISVQGRPLQLTPSEVSAALSKYADKGAGFDAKRNKTIGIHVRLRADAGMKLWEDMTEREHIDEFVDQVKKDYDKEAAKKIDYLMDRALDHLDPMSEVYKIILKRMGATISPSGSIKLPPELRSAGVSIMRVIARYNGRLLQ